MWIGYNCELFEVDVRKIVEKWNWGRCPNETLIINAVCGMHAHLGVGTNTLFLG